MFVAVILKLNLQTCSVNKGVCGMLGVFGDGGGLYSACSTHPSCEIFVEDYELAVTCFPHLKRKIKNDVSESK